MKTLAKTILLASIGLLSAVSAHADRSDQDHRFRLRMQDLQERIEHGVATHRLTPKEAKELQKQQLILFQMAWRFKQDGELSERERRKLDKRYEEVSDKIERYQHNHRVPIDRPKYGYDQDRHDDRQYAYPRHER